MGRQLTDLRDQGRSLGRRQARTSGSGLAPQRAHPMPPLRPSRSCPSFALETHACRASSAARSDSQAPAPLLRNGLPGRAHDCQTFASAVREPGKLAPPRKPLPFLEATALLRTEPYRAGQGNRDSDTCDMIRATGRLLCQYGLSELWQRLPTLKSALRKASGHFAVFTWRVPPGRRDRSSATFHMSGPARICLRLVGQNSCLQLSVISAFCTSSSWTNCGEPRHFCRGQPAAFVRRLSCCSIHSVSASGHRSAAAASGADRGFAATLDLHDLSRRSRQTSARAHLLVSHSTPDARGDAPFSIAATRAGLRSRAVQGQAPTAWSRPGRTIPMPRNVLPVVSNCAASWGLRSQQATITEARIQALCAQLLSRGMSADDAVSHSILACCRVLQLGALSGVPLSIS